jgi:hypothetical protein
VQKKKLHLAQRKSVKSLLVRKKKNVRMVLVRKKKRSLAALMITAKRNLSLKAFGVIFVVALKKRIIIKKVIWIHNNK